jgi:hypothetical protein
MTASTSLPRAVHSASNTWRAPLFEIVPSAMRAISAPASARSTGLVSISRPRR